MTQSMSVRFRQAAFAAVAILVSAGSIAHAQNQRRADDNVEPPHATSSIDATTTTAATLTQQRESRTLATAVFAKPAAAQRAADKAAEAYEPPIAPAPPKTEWLSDDGVRLGGKRALTVTAPF
jgi:hypothetical protein